MKRQRGDAVSLLAGDRQKTYGATTTNNSNNSSDALRSDLFNADNTFQLPPSRNRSREAKHHPAQNLILIPTNPDRAWVRVSKLVLQAIAVALAGWGGYALGTDLAKTAGFTDICTEKPGPDDFSGCTLSTYVERNFQLPLALTFLSLALQLFCIDVPRGLSFLYNRCNSANEGGDMEYHAIDEENQQRILVQHQSAAAKFWQGAKLSFNRIVGGYAGSLWPAVLPLVPTLLSLGEPNDLKWLDEDYASSVAWQLFFGAVPILLYRTYESFELSQWTFFANNVCLEEPIPQVDDPLPTNWGDLDKQPQRLV